MQPIRQGEHRAGEEEKACHLHAGHGQAYCVLSALSVKLVHAGQQHLYDITRFSYYNVTTRLVDLVGLCGLKQNMLD